MICKYYLNALVSKKNHLLNVLKCVDLDDGIRAVCEVKLGEVDTVIENEMKIGGIAL